MKSYSPRYSWNSNHPFHHLLHPPPRPFYLRGVDYRKSNVLPRKLRPNMKTAWKEGWTKTLCVCVCVTSLPPLGGIKAGLKGELWPVYNTIRRNWTPIPIWLPAVDGARFNTIQPRLVPVVALISPRSCKSDARQPPCFLIPLRRRLPPNPVRVFPGQRTWGGGGGGGLREIIEMVGCGVEENCNNRLASTFLSRNLSGLFGEIIFGDKFSLR